MDPVWGVVVALNGGLVWGILMVHDVQYRMGFFIQNYVALPPERPQGKENSSTSLIHMDECPTGPYPRKRRFCSSIHMPKISNFLRNADDGLLFFGSTPHTQRIVDLSL